MEIGPVFLGQQSDIYRDPQLQSGQLIILIVLFSMYNGEFGLQC